MSIIYYFVSIPSRNAYMKSIHIFLL